jgi:hypothetical protein
MPELKRPLKVFLCHAHADRDAVRTLYTRLIKDGVDAWLDKEKLLPGQDWELEIRKAVREADVVVVCLSKQFNQAGFRQKEVRLALDTAMEQPEGEIFIIPARLEECDTLESLRKWHWVDLFDGDGYRRLMSSLRMRAKNIGASLQIKRQVIRKPTAIGFPPKYVARFSVIRADLDSPGMEDAAYDRLYQMWLENKEDLEFHLGLQLLAKRHSNLFRELKIRHQGEKKDVLTESSGRKDSYKIQKSDIPKVFISYSHKDEKYKNELVTMLFPLQRTGVLDIWQDRQIEPGDEWSLEIMDAMITCDIAILLVSMHFLSSRFINQEEVPRLLQLRKEQGLRVVPIIVSPCMWQSEPVLKDLQALPKDGKPIQSFRGTGDRDQVWTDIAKSIEKLVITNS